VRVISPGIAGKGSISTAFLLRNPLLTLIPNIPHKCPALGDKNRVSRRHSPVGVLVHTHIGCCIEIRSLQSAFLIYFGLDHSGREVTKRYIIPHKAMEFPVCIIP